MIPDTIIQQKEPGLLGEMANCRAWKGKCKSGASCSSRKQKVKKKRKEGKRKKRKTRSNEMAPGPTWVSSNGQSRSHWRKKSNMEL